jgi:hypothetical protein
VVRMQSVPGLAGVHPKGVMSALGTSARLAMSEIKMRFGGGFLGVPNGKIGVPKDRWAQKIGGPRRSVGW